MSIIPSLGADMKDNAQQIVQIRASNSTKYCINVRRLTHSNVLVRTLIDTGSPVNLIKKSVYERSFSDRQLFRVKEEMRYKGINNSPVLIYSKMHDQIVLDDLKDAWHDIAFLVVDDKTMCYDVIISREFLNTSNIKLTYYNSKFLFEQGETYANWAHSILSISAIETKDKYDDIMQNLGEDVKFQERLDLINTFKCVDNTKIDLVNDNYNVRVHLKDNSFFRYAPRRISVSEKIELQKIIDDLLERGIIKSRISPYCSRVVLVTRRNGKSRMCIDLRSLNQRIFPQKYPFSLNYIEKVFLRSWI